MNTTWYEKGRKAERRAVVRDLLEEKFGTLSAKVEETLQQLPVDRLIGLTKAVLRAESLRELGLAN